MDDCTGYCTKAFISLPHLAHNMRLLQQQVGSCPLWPAIKANAYGHGADIIGRALVQLGYTRLCVAHLAEAEWHFASPCRDRMTTMAVKLPRFSASAVPRDR